MRGPPPYVAYGCCDALDLDDWNGAVARNHRFSAGSGAEPSSENPANRMAWNIGYTSYRFLRVMANTPGRSSVSA